MSDDSDLAPEILHHKSRKRVIRKNEAKGKQKRKKMHHQGDSEDEIQSGDSEPESHGLEGTLSEQRSKHVKRSRFDSGNSERDLKRKGKHRPGRSLREEEEEEEDEDEDEEEKEEEAGNDDEESIDEEGDDDQQESAKQDINDEFATLRKELLSMPFDELQQVKEKIGIKLYNQVIFGKGQQSGRKQFKRENKNRPMEISSKRKPRRFREVIPVKKNLVRDPRFDDLSGQFRDDIFKKSYSFLSDIKQKEKQKLLKQLDKEKDPDKKKGLEHLIHKMTTQEKAERKKEEQIERQRERKKQERKLVAEGKKPFYLKKSEQKKLELAEKYRELKKAGKVDKYLMKKRKKNAAKEKKNLPALQQ